MLLAAGLLFAASSVVFRNDWSEVALRPTTQGLCAALVIGYGLMPTGSAVQRGFYRLAGARWVQLVGLASYSIYLVHFPLIELVGALAPDAPPGLQFALNITLGVGVGALCYRFVEVPVLQWRQRRGL